MFDYEKHEESVWVRAFMRRAEEDLRRSHELAAPDAATLLTDLCKELLLALQREVMDNEALRSTLRDCAKKIAGAVSP